MQITDFELAHLNQIMMFVYQEPLCFFFLVVVEQKHLSLVHAKWILEELMLEVTATHVAVFYCWNLSLLWLYFFCGFSSFFFWHDAFRLWTNHWFWWDRSTFIISWFGYWCFWRRRNLRKWVGLNILFLLLFLFCFRWVWYLKWCTFVTYIF